MNGEVLPPFWRTAAIGLAGCTLFLWPFLAIALARPDATLGEMISNGGLVLLIGMWLACLFGIVVGRAGVSAP
jgi:hypothetical protein